MAEEMVFQIVTATDENGMTTWFWTHQSADEELAEERLIGPYETEEQAKNAAVSALTASNTTVH
jgi:hypothetical protein